MQPLEVLPGFAHSALIQDTDRDVQVKTRYCISWESKLAIAIVIIKPLRIAECGIVCEHWLWLGRLIIKAPYRNPWNGEGADHEDCFDLSIGILFFDEVAELSIWPQGCKLGQVPDIDIAAFTFKVKKVALVLNNGIVQSCRQKFS